ncbi:MAG: GAF domain-containing protein, partial [Chloroflexia bacterium]
MRNTKEVLDPDDIGRNGDDNSIRDELDELRARYSELYDSAPVGYLTLDRRGLVLEANLTAAGKLAVERDELIGSPLAGYVSADDQERLRKHLEQVFASKTRQVCEVKLNTDLPCCIRLESVQARQGGEPVCRMTLSDVTGSKQEEEARHFLARAGALLAESIDYHTTLANIAALCVPYLADWCVMDIVEEDGSIERLVVAQVDPEKAHLARELERRYPPPPGADHIVSRVIRTGEADINPHVTDEVLVAAARDAEHLRILRAMGLKSHMIVPMPAHGRTLGAITFVSAESGRGYDPADLEVADELARRAAVAIDNARLYREAQEASRRDRQHVTQLLGLTRAALLVNAALSVEDVLQTITERSRGLIGAHQAVTCMARDENWTELIKVVSLSEKYDQWRDYRNIPDGSGIYALPIKTGRSVRMTQSVLEAHPLWRGFGAEGANHPPMRGWLAAPLIGRDGRTIGLIQLSDKYEGE